MPFAIKGPGQEYCIAVKMHVAGHPRMGAPDAIQPQDGTYPAHYD